MKPGPSLAFRAIITQFEITAAPRPVVDLIVEVCLKNGWAKSAAEASEQAERWGPAVLDHLRKECSSLNQLGRFVAYDFNSSSPNYLQGVAFVEPRDTDMIRTAKQSRARFESYTKLLEALTPTEFESLCAGILAALGVDEPTLTPRSADEGIDFYGRLRLDRHIFTDKPLPGLQRQLGVWLIGQAKHYLHSQVSTPDLRDLVGAVSLAKVRAFGSGGEDKYKDLAVRICDPVFYLFFTTGRLTSNSWTLLDRSGVIGMDGQMLSTFLADHAIGVVNGEFNEAAARSWLSSHG